MDDVPPAPVAASSRIFAAPYRDQAIDAVAARSATGVLPT